MVPSRPFRIPIKEIWSGMSEGIDYRPGRPKPYRARYWPPNGRQRSKSFARKRDAQAWRNAQLAKIDRGEWIDPAAGAIRYRDWVDGWLTGLHVKPKTREGYESVLRSRVLPWFGSTPIRAIAPNEVRAFVTALVEEGLSASRIRQCRQVLSASLKQAVHDGRIGRNPVNGVKVPADRPRPPRFLTSEELFDLATAAEARWNQAGLIVLVLGLAGIRWGELVALRVSDIDLRNRRITIRESATEVRGKLVFGTPKNHQQRSVSFPPFLKPQLVDATVTKGPGDLVFTAPKGGPLRNKGFRTAVWVPAITKTGQENLRIHDLRHTAASLMIATGVTIKAVQNQLGHKTATMTLDRYGHLYTDEIDALGLALDKAISASSVAQLWPNGTKKDDHDTLLVVAGEPKALAVEAFSAAETITN